MLRDAAPEVHWRPDSSRPAVFDGVAPAHGQLRRAGERLCRSGYANGPHPINSTRDCSTLTKHSAQASAHARL